MTGRTLADVPETWAPGERKTKTSAAGNVNALLDRIITDLQLSTKEAEGDEQAAQKEYERLTKSLRTKIMETTDLLGAAEESKSAATTDLASSEELLDAQTDTLRDLERAEQDTHSQCDFILESFEDRKEARTMETEGLVRAKSILLGADFGSVGGKKFF